MKASVIIPTHDGEKYIGETLNSIFGQTRMPDEVVISDDSLSNKTTVIVRDIANTAPCPVKLVKGNATGISNNYMRALDHAVGDLVVVCDHDDIWVQERLAIIERKFVENDDVCLVCADSEVVDKNLNACGTTLRGGKKRSRTLSELAAKDQFGQFLLGMRFDAHSLAFRSCLKMLIQDRMFESARSCNFDHRVVIAAMAVGHIVYLPDALTWYRQHDGQHTRQKRRLSNQKLWGSRITELEDRIEQMNVLLDLLLKCTHVEWAISEQERNERVERLREYIRFSSDRACIKSSIERLCVLASNLSQGNYRQFARYGALSFFKDVIDTFKIRGRQV